MSSCAALGVTDAGKDGQGEEVGACAVPLARLSPSVDGSSRLDWCHQPSRSSSFLCNCSRHLEENG